MKSILYNKQQCLTNFQNYIEPKVGLDKKCSVVVTIQYSCFSKDTKTILFWSSQMLAKHKQLHNNL